MVYNVSDFIDAPKRLQSISNEEYLPLLESTLGEEDKFVSLLNVYYNKYPWFIQAIVMGSKHSFYSHGQFFTSDEFSKFKTPRYNYGSMSIANAMTSLIRLYDQRVVMDSAYRIKLLASVEMGLTNQDYQIFMRILKQEFLTEPVYEMIKKLWKSKRLAFSDLYCFDFTMSFNTLKNEPERRLFNISRTEDLAFINEELDTYILYRGTILSKDNKILNGEQYSKIQNSLREKNLSLATTLPVIAYIGTESNSLYILCNLTSEYEYANLIFAPQMEGSYVVRKKFDTDDFRKCILDEKNRYIVVFDDNRISGILSKNNGGIKTVELAMTDCRTLKLPNYTSEKGYMCLMDGDVKELSERVTVICENYSKCAKTTTLTNVIQCQGYYYHQ